MGMPRKKSREIHVLGVDYRWPLSADSGFMVIVVQDKAGRGQRLETMINYQDDTSGRSTVIVAPNKVERLIELGLRDGCKPQIRSLPPFKFVDAMDRLFGQ